MSEPTIDEMLQEVGRWESFYTSKDFSDGVRLSRAIRVVLEQHRELQGRRTEAGVVWRESGELCSDTGELDGSDRQGKQLQAGAQEG